MCFPLNGKNSYMNPVAFIALKSFVFLNSSCTNLIPSLPSNISILFSVIGLMLILLISFIRSLAMSSFSFISLSKESGFDIE